MTCVQTSSGFCTLLKRLLLQLLRPSILKYDALVHRSIFVSAYRPISRTMYNIVGLTTAVPRNLCSNTRHNLLFYRCSARNLDVYGTKQNKNIYIRTRIYSLKRKWPFVLEFRFLAEVRVTDRGFPNAKSALEVVINSLAPCPSGDN